MSVAVASRDLPAINAPTPFGDKSFKFIRVTADTLSRLCLALFYKIISLSCWIFSAKTSHHYASLARYHYFRGINPLTTYLRFGSEVMDFSINSPTRVKEYRSSPTNELEELKKIYGNKAIERWFRLETKEIPFQINRLSRREMAADGCCFGMSLDFISYYLQLIRSGMPPREAVKAIAHRYVDGAPDEAQLAQIFYHALDISKFKEAEVRLFKEINNKKHEELNRWFEAENKRIQEFAHSDKNMLEEQLAVQKKEREQNLQREVCSEMLLYVNHATLQCAQIIASAFGLVMEDSSIFMCEKIEKEPDCKFKDFINKLPARTYAVCFNGQVRGGHSICFIKTAEECFIHEPNFATLEPVDPATRLWMRMRDFYLRYGACCIRFYPCSETFSE